MQIDSGTSAPQPSHRPWARERGEVLHVATRNKNKLSRYERLAQLGSPIRLEPMPEGVVQAKEPYDTLEANSLTKAVSMLRNCPDVGQVLSDDSGLSVKVLGGLPGARSADWYSDHDDARNRAMLLELLGEEPDRDATLSTVLTYACRHEGALYYVQFRADMPGRISRPEECAARGGFGYEPVFVPYGFGGIPLSEFSDVSLDVVSHRARAFSALRAFLRTPPERRHHLMWEYVPTESDWPCQGLNLR